MDTGPKLDPGSVKPLYEQLADWAEGEITSGRMAPGTKFADSRDLAEEWGVAYQTVRRAIRELRERGLVESRVGKGTFVKVRPLPALYPPVAAPPGGTRARPAT